MGESGIYAQNRNSDRRRAPSFEGKFTGPEARRVGGGRESSAFGWVYRYFFWAWFRGWARLTVQGFRSASPSLSPPRSVEFPIVTHRKAESLRSGGNGNGEDDTRATAMARTLTHTHTLNASSLLRGVNKFLCASTAVQHLSLCSRARLSPQVGSTQKRKNFIRKFFQFRLQSMLAANKKAKRKIFID
jgi:hypothetical protein